ncbi:hypothetical protein [Streptomyces tagetis]|uniref:Uncharacterized protein n=1 Tax=Streptomyces tagetis TaxID=2820809 RepID=A0A940XDQ8_9ACTN|nr:hypothetical protein [Streptomyces sp. RG38]MBQ0826639.1 hypothetical protein [Streptomyces sp. RG38]
MTLRIGEISNEVLVDDAARTAEGPAERTAAHQPGWAERDRHRRRAEAEARDASRTAEEDRHG